MILSMVVVPKPLKCITRLSLVRKYATMTSPHSTLQYRPADPKIILRNFKSVEEYFGIVKCTVLHPRGLYHPVLPYRYNRILTNGDTQKYNSKPVFVAIKKYQTIFNVS